MLNFLKRGLSSSYLAIDIGTTSIKVVEVNGGGKAPRVENYGFLESSGYLARSNQALQTSSLKIFEADIVELLKTIVKEMGTGTKDALASLPPFAVFTAMLDFPLMEKAEVEKAIVYQ